MGRVETYCGVEGWLFATCPGVYVVDVCASRRVDAGCGLVWCGVVWCAWWGFFSLSGFD